MPSDRCSDPPAPRVERGPERGLYRVGPPAAEHGRGTESGRAEDRSGDGNPSQGVGANTDLLYVAATVRTTRARADHSAWLWAPPPGPRTPSRHEQT